ncbi:hypothetical protein [Novosphingobium panipatense]|uniref:hypothetical protein n=1 Tax=Novosphingobium panipatense TaxID=428991 RepID=UPI00362424AF
MIHYTLSHLEAAASLWEAVLDLRDHPAAEPDALVRALAIRKSFEAMGTCAMRIIVVGWIDAVDAAWYRNQETCPFCFDWSFVKQWVIDTIDWSDPDNPAIRIDASGTDITDNVTTAAQAGAKSPGPAGPQITRHDHVALLARARRPGEAGQPRCRSTRHIDRGDRRQRKRAQGLCATLADRYASGHHRAPSWHQFLRRPEP